MKRNGKRFLGILLSLCMILSFIPVNIFAQEADTISDNELAAVLADYAAYRTPAEILSEDYDYSDDQISGIMSGDFSDPQIRYVSTDGELKDAVESSDVKIIVLENNLEVSDTVIIAHSVTLLSDTPKVITRAREEGWQYSIFQVSTESGSPITEGDIVINFSNVIMRCTASNVSAVNVLADVAYGQSEPSESSVLLKGANVQIAVPQEENTNNRYSIDSVSAVGSLKLVGCTIENKSDPSVSVYRGGVSITPRYGNIQITKCTLNGVGYGINVSPMSEYDGEIEVTDCTFTGGSNGLYLNSANIKSDVTVQRCTFTNQACETIMIYGEKISFNDVTVKFDKEKEDLPSGGQFFCVAPYVTMDKVEVLEGTNPLMFTGLNELTVSNSKFTLNPREWGQTYRRCYVHNSGTATFKDTTISGYEYAIEAYGFHGEGDLTLNHCQIKNNEIGITVYENAKVNILSSEDQLSEISGNEIGILQKGGEISISEATISGNGSETGDAEKSGGIWVEKLGELTIADSTISDNHSAFSGAGIHFDEETLPTEVKIQGESKFIGNRTQGFGGAIYIKDYAKLITDEETEFSNNKASLAYKVLDKDRENYPNIKFASTSIYDHPLNNYDISYEIVPVSITADAELEPLTVDTTYTTDDLKTRLAEKYSKIVVSLSDDETETLDITWNVDDSEFKSGELGPYTIYGGFNLPEDGSVTNPNEYHAIITVTVSNLPRIMSVEPLESISFGQGVSVKEVQEKLDSEHSPLLVELSNDTYPQLSVTWKVTESGFDGEICGDYTIYGEIMADESQYLNPDEVKPSIVVTVEAPNLYDIASIVNPRPREVPQHILLGPTEKGHAIGGVPTTEDLPPTVTVSLSGGDTEDLPVNWNKGSYNPKILGEQEVEGTFDLSEYPQIENSQNLNPMISITVTKAQYDVLEVSTNGAYIEVLPGTTLAEIQAQLEEEGKAEVHVNAFDSETRDEIYTYCDLILTDEANPEWIDYMDQPSEDDEVYELKISLPEDFTEVDEIILDESAAKVQVRVLPPLEIVDVEEAKMDAYQSVEPENLENIPEQVIAVLSNGMKVPVDVVWNWKGSAYDKDSDGNQIVNGDLVNLPSKAKQPESGDWPGTLNVNVIAVNYKVIDVQQSEDIFESQALLTLEEITELIHPTATMTISSITPGIKLKTTYEVDILLESEKNPHFDRKYADVYVLDGTLKIDAKNITVPTDTDLSEVYLQTDPVDIKAVEEIHVTVSEGTEFEDIEKIGAVVTFDVKGPGEKEDRKETVEVDWGTGEGYNPYPFGDDEGDSFEIPISGTLASNVTDYANTAGVSVPIVIKVVRAYELTKITPNRFPASGAMEVKLGSTLEDIYNLLDTHTVELKFKSLKDTEITSETTFQLRKEDNDEKALETEGIHTLTASFALPAGVTNPDPDNLKVEIVVKTTKYIIKAVNGVTVSVVSGTEFEDVPLPKEVTVKYDVGDDTLLDVAPVAQWNGSTYNPTRLASQVVRGTLGELPMHLENPNNRQPSAIVKVTDPDAEIVSLKLITAQTAKMMRVASVEDTSVPGYKAYRYIATIRYKDGTVSEEIISTYVETGENG